MEKTLESDIGTLFYRHHGSTDVNIEIHAERVGQVLRRNKINIFKVENGKSRHQAKLIMFGFTVRSSQDRFNLGSIKISPGDELYAQPERRGLKFTVSSATQYKNNFADMFS